MDNTEQAIGLSALQHAPDQDAKLVERLTHASARVVAGAASELTEGSANFDQPSPMPIDQMKDVYWLAIPETEGYYVWADDMRYIISARGSDMIPVPKQLRWTTSRTAPNKNKATSELATGAHSRNKVYSTKCLTIVFTDSKRRKVSLRRLDRMIVRAMSAGTLEACTYDQIVSKEIERRRRVDAERDEQRDNLQQKVDQAIADGSVSNLDDQKSEDQILL